MRRRFDVFRAIRLRVPSENRVLFLSFMMRRLLNIGCPSIDTVYFYSNGRYDSRNFFFFAISSKVYWGALCKFKVQI